MSSLNSQTSEINQTTLDFRVLKIASFAQQLQRYFPTKLKLIGWFLSLGKQRFNDDVCLVETRWLHPQVIYLSKSWKFLTYFPLILLMWSSESISNVVPITGNTIKFKHDIVRTVIPLNTRFRGRTYLAVQNDTFTFNGLKRFLGTIFKSFLDGFVPRCLCS